MTGLRWALAAGAALRARASVAFWTAVAYLRLRAHGAQVGPGLQVRGPIRLHCHRSGRIRLGRGCRMQSGFAGNPVGEGHRLAIWVGPGARLELGDRVGLSNSTIVCMDAVTIADEAMVGGGCRIYDTDFHSLDSTERTLPGNPGARTAAVAIRRRAFVGGHSLVLKGSVVGEGAVVGAGSVVRGAVPAGQVWAGNPAVFVRDLREAGERRRPRGLEAAR
jgi:acetyltransferase-like isoleucine patch superfamily enzyme